jgi:hypothetical protein
MAVRAILSSARTRRGAARDPARGASPTREAEGATRDALDANAPDLAESEAADIVARRAELWRGRAERAEESERPGGIGEISDPAARTSETRDWTSGAEGGLHYCKTRKPRDEENILMGGVAPSSTRTNPASTVQTLRRTDR